MEEPYVTMLAIAKHCHVSIATVSRALNDKTGVSKELKSKILRFANEHQYIPDHTAQSMRSRRTNYAYIVFLFEPNGKSRFLPLFNDLIHATAEVDTRLHPISFHTDLITDLQRIENRYKPKLFVFAGPCLVKDTKHFRKIHTPLLFVSCNDAPDEYPSVVSDDAEGAEALVDSMLEAGHTRIAVITNRNTQGKANYSSRVQGYRKALAQHGITYDPALVYSIPVDFSDYLASSEAQIRRRILPLYQHRLKHLRYPPTAIFVLNDFLALTLMRVFWNAGVHIPEELSVTSFGGCPVTQYIPISLHTWVQPVHDLLITTATAMSCIIDHKPFPSTLSLPTKHPDGRHGTAWARSPRKYMVTGYLRDGQSLAPPRE